MEYVCALGSTHEEALQRGEKQTQACTVLTSTFNLSTANSSTALSRLCLMDRLRACYGLPLENADFALNSQLSTFASDLQTKIVPSMETLPTFGD